MQETLVQTAETLAQKLQQNEQRICLAESCTGGMLSKILTDMAGSSIWFDSAFIVYSNQAKQSMLGINPKTLLQYGAVSEETAKEMASSALKNSGVDHSIAITGIAGPTGDTPDKPVGMVCFAWANKQQCVTAMQYLSGDREAIRVQSCLYAMQVLLANL